MNVPSCEMALGADHRPAMATTLNTWAGLLQSNVRLPNLDLFKTAVCRLIPFQAGALSEIRYNAPKPNCSHSLSAAESINTGTIF